LQSSPQKNIKRGDNAFNSLQKIFFDCFKRSGEDIRIEHIMQGKNVLVVGENKRPATFWLMLLVGSYNPDDPT
jgi:hypothetical protein